MDQQLTPEELRLDQLRKQLSETLTAERFFETDTGRLWKELATAEINSLIKDITSDKYEKDHAGYVNANRELKVWRRMLLKMQVAASPVRKAKLSERIAETDGQQ